MRYFKSLFVGLCVAVLAACGGGGGSSGDSTFGSGSGSGTGSSGGSGSGSGTGSGTTASPTVSLSLSSTTITAQAPATLTVTVRDAAGAPVSGKVVNLSFSRGGLAVLAATSALTSSTGMASVSVQAASGGVTGADELVASAVLGTTTVQSSIGFSVTGATATIAASVSSTTIRASAGAITLTGTVRDSSGQPLTGQIVRFSAGSDALVLSAASALTSASGTASVTATARDPSANAAESLVVATRVNGVDLQSSVNVQLVGESPSIALTLSSSTVSSTATSTVQALVKDSAGVAVSGAVVSFKTQFNLGTFDAATAVTNASGVASVVLSPAAASTSGADFVVSSVSVGGVQKSAQAVVQFAPTSGTVASGTPTLSMALSSTSISAAQPATATATLTDSRGNPVSGQVIGFKIVRDLAVTNVATALTDASGRASVVVSPATTSTAGADEVNASANFGGAALQATRGFQINATPVTLQLALPAGFSTLSAYGQTTLDLSIAGASTGAPVNLGITSACVSRGKATLSPATFTATTSTVQIQYRDLGCGALQASDQLQANVVGTAISSGTLSIPISTPDASSIAFVSAQPEAIFVKGSGFAESSLVTFQVRDAAGNPLPNLAVDLRLLTGAGGVTMDGKTAADTLAPNPAVTVKSDAEGRIVARVNSGTVPTPVRIQATLPSASISTVSSNLSVGVGLPSQLNFSLSQAKRNIEAYNSDGVLNNYQVIASDRRGNPVPIGTSINFTVTSGQIEPIRQIQSSGGLALTTAAYITAAPRPLDGRITVVAYALGEESFIDLNGNNIWDPGEPFQDLGTVFIDRNFDGSFDAAVEETIPLAIGGGATCAPLPSGAAGTLLALDPSVPTLGASTCDGVWSGAGRVYVRRAIQTVLATSESRLLWATSSPAGLPTVGLGSTCSPKIPLRTDSSTLTTLFRPLSSVGDEWFAGDDAGSVLLEFVVADKNPVRLNPMASGTEVSYPRITVGSTATSSTLETYIVPSTLEAGRVLVQVDFASGSPVGTFATVNLKTTSPSGSQTAYKFTVRKQNLTSGCAP